MSIRKKRPIMQVVPVSAVVELQKRIDEYERFCNHLLLTFYSREEPLSIKFPEPAHRALELIRKDFKQLGIKTKDERYKD